MLRLQFPLSHAAWLRLFAIATAEGCAFAVQIVSSNWQAITRAQVWRVTALQVVVGWAWFACLPLVFAICERIPVRRGALLRGIAVHTGAAIVVCTLRLLLLALPTQWLLPERFPESGGLLGGALALVQARLVSDTLVYALIATGWHAFVYLRELDRRAVERAALQQQLAEAELRELRTQLQPHFLSNALNAIVAYVREDPAVAETMLLRLHRFLRQVLTASRAHRIPLEDEFALLAEYLAIHQMRFGARLSVELVRDPSTDTVLVPVMILQPLVENALVHGVGAKAGPGRVAVRAERRRQQLTLCVEDNGDADSSSALQGATRGVGLTNSRQRLQLLYGDRHDLQFESIAGGTRVTLVLPIEKEHGD